MHDYPRLQDSNHPVQRTAREQAIVDHVTRHLARPRFEIDEVDELTGLRIGIHAVAPAPGRDFWFLFTTGMSARPMTKPSGAPGARLAELCLLLPSKWPLDGGLWRTATKWSWPIRELREAALLPHRFQTWLSAGHAIMPVDVSASFTPSRSLDPSTRLSSFFVLPTDTDVLPKGHDVIELLTLVSVYPEELQYQIDHGIDALLDAFSAAGISDVIEPARRSAVVTSTNN